MHYTKVVKFFYDSERQKQCRFVFYIRDEVSTSPYVRGFSFSYFKLLSFADIVIKDNEIVKNRSMSMEETFDSLLGI